MSGLSTHLVNFTAFATRFCTTTSELGGVSLNHWKPTTSQLNPQQSGGEIVAHTAKDRLEVDVPDIRVATKRGLAQPRSPQIVRKKSVRDRKVSTGLNDVTNAFAQVRSPFRRDPTTTGSRWNSAADFPWYY